MSGTLRVVIADDHAIVRDGLRALLASVPDIEVVGEAATGDELLELADQVQPDVAVVDVQMPGGGIAATRALGSRCPGTGVLILTMHDEGTAMLGALRAGARGYVVKGAGREEVIQAVRAVGRGEAVLGSGVARAGLGLLLGTGRPAAVFPELTPREHEVLELIAEGLDNDEIGLRLGLTLKTVRNNVATIYTKLGVSDRAKAVARARDAGLGGHRPQRPDR